MRMMKRTHAAFLAVVLMSPVSGAKVKVSERVDPFTDDRIVYTAPLAVKNARWSTGKGAYLALILERSQKPGLSVRFHLKIFCGRSRNDQAKVAPGNTLKLWTGNRVALFYSPGSEATRPAPGERRPERLHVYYEDIPYDDLL